MDSSDSRTKRTIDRLANSVQHAANHIEQLDQMLQRSKEKEERIAAIATALVGDSYGNYQSDREFWAAFHDDQKNWDDQKIIAYKNMIGK